MNNNESRTLWVSLAAGLLAAFLIYGYSQDEKAKYDKAYGAFKSVVVARQDIPEMRTIDDTMLEVVQKPADFLEPQSITDPNEAVGQVAAVPIKKGEQVLHNKLLQPGPDTGISLQVTPRKRAVTLPVDEVRGIAKLIRPGDRLDIIAAIDSGKGISQKREVQTIMQDVIVLATGVNVLNNIPRIFEMEAGGKNVQQISLTGDTKYSTITIEATPKDAQDLIYILSTSPGNLYFTLRNPTDTETQRLPSSSSDSLMGRSSYLAPTTPAPASVAPPAPPAPEPKQQPKKASSRFRDL